MNWVCAPVRSLGLVWGIRLNPAVRNLPRSIKKKVRGFPLTPPPLCPETHKSNHILNSLLPSITICDTNKRSDLRAFSGPEEPSVADFTTLFMLASTHRSNYTTALPNYYTDGQGQLGVADFQFFRNY